jgi:hypothetical protein
MAASTRIFLISSLFINSPTSKVNVVVRFMIDEAKLDFVGKAAITAF